MIETDKNTTPSEAQVGFEAGIDAADAATKTVEIVGIPVAILPVGQVARPMVDVLAISDERAEKPRRLAGTATHQEIDSFIAHANRFKDQASAVYADVTAVRLTAVLDYHTGPGAPRWGLHRSLYSCPLSEPWEAWHGFDGKPRAQTDFAQWIEDRMADLTSGKDTDGNPYPAPADVLSMARNLAVYSKGTFERKINPTTGDSALVAKTETETTSTKIPRAFALKLPVFDGGAMWAVEAKIRLTFEGGFPRFAYSLHRTDAILRDAFGEVRARVAKETGLPVFCGTPEETA
jgi:uncharacterized protein YfdQ (DUF2303 family)